MTTVASRPMRYGKSTLVDGAFLASCEAGESSLYENPKYTCFSRKALEAFKTKVREEERKKVLELLVEIRKQAGLCLDASHTHLEKQRTGKLVEMVVDSVAELSQESED